MSPPPFVRTPDANFDGLADFPFEPHYLDIDGLRMHYVDAGHFLQDTHGDRVARAVIDRINQ